jgi:hypothetical protein
MSIEELEELAYMLDLEDILRINRQTALSLRKRGIKLREFKWDEFEAS